jgi:nucleotide-binding universal stress UspA family protein
MSPPRIIVGVDGSDPGRAALAWGIAESIATRRPLVLVRALTPAPAMANGGPPRSSASASELERSIQAAREQLEEETVEGVALAGPPNRALLTAAGPADLIVVGGPSHRHPFDQRTTARLLIHHTPGPLVVVPGTPTIDAGPRPGLAFPGHVVVGADGSAASRAALEFGFDYADKHGLPLAAIHIGRKVGDTDVWFDDTFLETHLSHEPSAAVGLSTLVEPLELAHPRVAVKRAVLAGRPRAGLLQSAHRAALLVVGRPRAGVLNSVSHAVVDEAPCAVAIVHTPED